MVQDYVINRWALQLVALVVVTLAAACDRVDASAGGSTAAGASQARTIDLAGGRLPALPSGPLYIRVVEFSQDAGSAFRSHQHVPGLVYVQTGVQRLIVVDGPPIEPHHLQSADVRGRECRVRQRR